jgi:hypothetical protein
MKQSDIHSLRKDILTAGLRGELCMNYADDELLTYDSVLTLVNLKGLPISYSREEVLDRLHILGLKVMSISAEEMRVAITPEAYIII